MNISTMASIPLSKPDLLGFSISENNKTVIKLSEGQSSDKAYVTEISWDEKTGKNISITYTDFSGPGNEVEFDQEYYVPLHEFWHGYFTSGENDYYECVGGDFSEKSVINIPIASSTVYVPDFWH